MKGVQSLVAGKWWSLNLAFLRLGEIQAFSISPCHLTSFTFFLVGTPSGLYRHLISLEFSPSRSNVPSSFSLSLKDRILGSHHCDISPFFDFYQVNNVLFKVGLLELHLVENKAELSPPLSRSHSSINMTSH